MQPLGSSICRRCARQSTLVGGRRAVVVGGAGGRQHSVAARVVAKQEFAGYWEYVLDEAIFTAPAHPKWGGAALIGAHGDLIGVGSLQLEQARETGQRAPQHDRADRLLKPILDDLLKRPPQPPAAPVARPLRDRDEDKLIVVGLAEGGPAQRADLRTGDMVLAVAGSEVTSSPTCSAHLVARRGRGRGAAARSIATADLRSGQVGDRTLSQRAEPALSSLHTRCSLRLEGP